MKKTIGIIVIILMIPVIISIIGDIDRTPVYPTTEFNIIDKPSNKQLLSNDKLLYQLPNTVNFTTNELPEYVEYYEYGLFEVDSGILNYTINDNLAYINYIEAELSQVINGELIVSKPTLIISRSNNLFDESKWTIRDIESSKNVLKFNGYVVPSTGMLVGSPLILLEQEEIKQGSSYTVSGNFKQTLYFNQLVVRYSDGSTDRTTIFSDNYVYSSRTITLDPEREATHIFIDTGDKGAYGYVEEETLTLNEGTTALPYQPFAEHIYNLDNGVELYKLPNGIGDIWYKDGTLERNVGVIDTVNYYAEYGTLTTGTYENILEFIDNNQNKQIKLFFNDNIQESRYNIYLENDTIIINNDTEIIRIYNNDTYTSTLNLDTDITYKLEGYNILEYIDGEFDNTVLAFFWIIPVLLVGGLIYLLLKRKE